jgi:predicted component of type VI protein secretion system
MCVNKVHKLNDILRLRSDLAALRDQLLASINALDSRIESLLPDYEAAARYQRLRVISSDRAKTKAFMEGR